MIGTPWSNIFFVEVTDYVRIEVDDPDPENPVVLSRWIYDVKQVVFQTPAKDKPEVISVGLVKTYKALNVYEYSNTETTDMGISIEDLPGDFELKPVPTGTIVPAFMASGFQTDTSLESGAMIMLLWPNQFDGVCTDEETP